VIETEVLSLVVYLRTLIYPPKLSVLHIGTYPPFLAGNQDQDPDPHTAIVCHYLRVDSLDLNLQEAHLLTLLWEAEFQGLQEVGCPNHQFIMQDQGLGLLWGHLDLHGKDIQGLPYHGMNQAVIMLLDSHLRGTLPDSEDLYHQHSLHLD
jgi:hypothetical protein